MPLCSSPHGSHSSPLSPPTLPPPLTTPLSPHLNPFKPSDMTGIKCPVQPDGQSKALWLLRWRVWFPLGLQTLQICALNRLQGASHRRCQMICTVAAHLVLQGECSISFQAPSKCVVYRNIHRIQFMYNMLPLSWVYSYANSAVRLLNASISMPTCRYNFYHVSMLTFAN